MTHETYEQFRARLARIEEEILTELYGRMPWGAEFRLSDGSTARIVEMNGVSGKSRPKVREDGALSMIFDAKLEGGPLDHVEISVRVSGGGGFVG